MLIGLAIVTLAIGILTWKLVKVSDDEDEEIEDNEWNNIRRLARLIVLTLITIGCFPICFVIWTLSLTIIIVVGIALMGINIVICIINRLKKNKER